MTVTALVLLDRFYSKNISPKFMYATLGLLFVNVSIGGTLTPFAAPPVIMVAGKWGWDLQHMILNFGWKGVLSCVLSTLLVVYRFRNNLSQIHFQNSKSTTAMAIPLWVSILHLIILAMIVVTAHYMAVFVGFFLLFLGVASVTREYQTELKLKEGLLVAFFLAGIVVLGGPQQWWLEPLLGKLSTATLYLGAIGLTAVTDNAALTYLGSLVPTLSDESKYFLVAGAVVGGGLTVIANAPNPAGYGILNSSFGENGISPVSLFLAALPPTLIAAACFWFL
jgi:Na+/H+ antiporter NhaD/arsenite permease-like protein